MEVNTAEAQQMAIDARIAAEEAARKVEEAEKAAREKVVILILYSKCRLSFPCTN